jgi:carbonic anhydrase/acetyltransferase-like protein (isoleucine patch superfamily)
MVRRLIVLIQEYKGIKPKIHPDTYIHETAVIIGDVEIEEGVSIWPYVVIRGDSNKITIGKNTNIQDGCILHADTDRPLIIGEGVTVGHKAILHACTIEGDTLIGMGSTILDYAIIKKGSIVGAGSLVAPGKVYEKNSLIVGVPGKMVRETTPEERESIKKSAANYLKTAHQYKGK